MYFKLINIILLFLPVILYSATVIDENINQDEIWTEAQSPYIINNDLIISSGKTLTISEGVKVQIADDKIISVRGNIVCNGLPGKPVIFEAIDSYWGGIFIDRSSDEAIFKFCEFNNGGRSSFTQSSVLIINESSIYAEYCKFFDSYRYAVTSFRDGYADLGGGKLNSRGNNIFLGFSVNRYAIVNKSKIEIDAKYNCWDNENTDELIYDYKDNNARGLVNFNPYNTDCEPKKPNKPQPFFPPDSSVEMPVYLNLKWNSINDISDYQVQLSEDFNFMNNIFDKKTDDSLFAVYNLKYGKRYFWRVRAENYIGKGDWSDTFTFVTYDTAKPYETIINYPKNNDITDCNFVAEWEIIENASEYHLVLVSDNFKIDTLIKDNFYDFEYLPNNKFLNLKVRGINRNGYGKWSDVIEFKTRKHFIDNKSNVIEDYDIVHQFHYSAENYLLLVDSTDNYYIYDGEINNIDNNIEIAKYASINFNQTKDFLYSYNNKLTIEYDQSDQKQFIFTEGKIKSFDAIDIDNKSGNELIIRTELHNSDILKIYIYENDKYVEIDNTIGLNSISEYLIFDYDLNGINDIVVIDNFLVNIFKFDNNQIISEELDINISNLKKTEHLDINNDGYQDLIILDGKRLSFFKNNSGEFIIDSIYDDKVINDFTIADINNSGSMDIIYTDTLNNLYLFNNGKIIDSLKNKYYVFDINNDTRPDILTSDKIYENNSCEDNIELSQPDNLRYSYLSEGINLEWDRTKINNRNNYNILYQIQLYNTQTKDYFYLQTYNNYLNTNELDEGIYIWNVRAIWNNSISSDYSDTLELYTRNMMPLPPDSWQFENKTGLNSTILIRNANTLQIDTVKAGFGDALGVFFIDSTKLKCAGYTFLNENKVVLTAWGDNNQTFNIKDGFDIYENFRFKYWDASEKSEFPVNVNFSRGVDRFKPDTLSEISSIFSLDTNIVLISSDKWNFISSDIIPFYPNIDSIIDDKDISLINSEKEVYSNEFKKFNLWNSDKGYKAFSNQKDSLMFIGYKLNNRVIYLRKNSWQLIPITLNNDTISVENFAADAISPQLQLVSDYGAIKLIKNDKGEICIPDINIYQFDSLLPDKSYYVYSDEDIELIIKNDKIFPNWSFKKNELNHDEEIKEKDIDLEINEIYENQNEQYPEIIHNSGNTSHYLIINEGDNRGYIAAYSKSGFIGSTEINSDTTILAVKGIDTLKYTGGAAYGDNIHLKFYSYSGEEYDVNPKMIYDELNNEFISGLSYKQNEFISLRINTNEITSVKSDKINLFELVQNNDEIIIESNIKIDEIAIYNLTGQLIKRIENPNLVNSLKTNDLLIGIYFVVIKADEFIDDKLIIIE